MSSLFLMSTITDRRTADAFLQLYEAHGVNVTLRTVGTGTAVQETLSTLGLEKTEKAVYTISLVAQSARSEAGKRRQLFLMRWDFAGSNPCTPKRNGDAGGGFAEQSA